MVFARGTDAKNGEARAVSRRAAGLVVTLLVVVLCASIHDRAEAASPKQAAIAFETISVPNGAEPPLRVAIWYPTKGRELETKLEDFPQRVVPGGAFAGTKLPLVVISHGGGGSFAGHYDTALALARAGFVAAAVDHAGDMVGDESKVLQLWRRPQQLSEVVTYLLSGWRWKDRINPRRIGAYGFSNGGFTVLVAAGGVPDLTLIDPYCRANPKQDLCSALASAGVKSVGALPIPKGAWKHDARIRAIAVAAPGFAPVFDHGGLRDVNIPVQLWYGSADRHQPGPWYGQLVLRELPRRPELHVVSGAGHYDFLAPCPPVLARAVPLICTEANGFDRTAFHHRLNDELVKFFRASLPVR